MSGPRLSVRHLEKSFASPVLRDFSLDVRAGEVHALVGENGAGKSTFANIVGGLLAPDGGSMELEGQPYSPQSCRDAYRAGISYAAQELGVIETLSVAENVCLKNLPRRRGVVARQALRRDARRALEVVGLGDLDPDIPLSALPLAARQLVELARTLLHPARLLVLDEPTAALNDEQAGCVHAAVRRAVGDGAAAIYVSHRLGDVLDLADTITVLRDGTVVSSRPSADSSVERMMADMAGEILLQAGRSRTGAKSGAVSIVAEALTTAALPFPVDLAVCRGEIVGVAGLAGAGKSELLRALFGLDRLTGGRLAKETRGGVLEVGSARQAVVARIGYLAEDRKTGGIFPGLPVLENVMLPGSPAGRSAIGAIDRRTETALFDAQCRRLGIRAAGGHQRIEQLSGGNQQKALLARWLCRDPEVLLLDEPTRGVDVRTKTAIYDLLFELADAGLAIVFASADLEEQQVLADRVLVLSGRMPVGEFARGEWTEAALLAAAFHSHTSEFARSAAVAW